MQRSRLWTSWHELELTSHTEVTNNASQLHVDAALNLSRPELASRVQLDWDKPGHLWDSEVSLATAVLRLNSSVVSRRSEDRAGEGAGDVAGKWALLLLGSSYCSNHEILCDISVVLCI